MFDNNEKINVGRDINVNIKTFADDLSYKELKDKKTESTIVIKKERKAKIKRIGWLTLFSFIFFSILYVTLPIFFNFLSHLDSLKYFEFIFNVEFDENEKIFFTGLIALLPFGRAIFEMFFPNDLQKKHYELIKSINLLIKEKEHLGNG